MFAEKQELPKISMNGLQVTLLSDCLHTTKGTFINYATQKLQFLDPVPILYLSLVTIWLDPQTPCAPSINIIYERSQNLVRYIFYFSICILADQINVGSLILLPYLLSKSAYTKGSKKRRKITGGQSADFFIKFIKVSIHTFFNLL